MGLGASEALKDESDRKGNIHMSQRDSMPRTSDTRTISLRLSLVILPASARSSQVATIRRPKGCRERWKAMRVMRVGQYRTSNASSEAVGDSVDESMSAERSALHFPGSGGSS